MSFQRNNFSQQRKQSLYQREISHILYQIIQEYNLPSFSLTHCQLSGRGENIKVYLTFARKEKQQETLKLINQQYLPLIKKTLARGKKFAYLPKLVFLLDQEIEILNNLDQILQKFTNHAN